MTDIETNREGLVRELGLAEAATIGLGTMLGAGIFVLSAIAAEGAGPAAAVSYILAGVIVMPTALTVSELATGMPEAGGSYHLISRSLGPLAGAIVGPGNWLGLTFATAFYLIGFAEYMAYFLPIPVAVTVLAGGVLFAYLNYRGAKSSGRVQNIIVAILLLILAYFAGRAFFNVDPELHRPFFPYGWGAVVTNVGLVIVSFTGFEKISTIAAEVKNPGRTLPTAIVGSVIVATLLYAAILYTATGIIPYAEMAGFQAPLVETARRFLGTFGIVGMSAAALLATASSANAAIMASSRINYAMGRDLVLPGWFSEIHPVYRTPYHSVLATAGLATVLALSGQAGVLAEISSALFMVSYALLALSLIVVRTARPSWYQPRFQTPLFPWLPILGGVLALAVIAIMDPLSQVAGIGFVALSLVWYWLWSRRRTSVEGALLPWLARERPLDTAIADVQERAEATRQEILIPVANPQTVRALVRLAATLARGWGKTDARVVALNVTPVPLSLPLSAAREHIRDEGRNQQEALRKAEVMGEEAQVPVTTLWRAAHGIASGVIAVARGRPQTRLILLGWHGPLTLSRIRTSIDKAIVRDAPHDVAILLDRGLALGRERNGVTRILIPAGGGPHARFGLRLAEDLAAGNGENKTHITILRVLPQMKTDNHSAEEAAAEKLLKDEISDTRTRIRTRVVQANSVVAGILNAAGEGYDLIIIGASEEWAVRNWLFGAIPDRVAAHSPCSVLAVRKHEPSPISWLRRALKRIGT